MDRTLLILLIAGFLALYMYENQAQGQETDLTCISCQTKDYEETHCEYCLMRCYRLYTMNSVLLGGCFTGEPCKCVFKGRNGTTVVGPVDGGLPPETVAYLAEITKEKKE